MGLERELYFFNDENDCSIEFVKNDETPYVTRTTDVKDFNTPLKLKNVKRLVINQMYWSKATAIHKWFVDNVQSGEDDCGKYEVTLEQIKELVDTCKKVLENHDLAQELLPTQSGIVCGEDYDEYYFQELERTVKELENIEEEMLNQEGIWETFYYHSSW